MNTTFIEKDFINEIRDNSSYKKWEVASPCIFKLIYEKSSLVWNTFIMDTLSYKYTFIQCPTVFGMARIYIFCLEENLFDDKINNDSNALYNWLKEWGRRPILVSTPILYDTLKGQLYSWNVYSYKKYYESLENKELNPWELEEETDILKFFIESKCFCIASGHIYALGLHRAGILSANIVISALDKWRMDFPNEVHEWSIYFKNTPHEDMLFIHSGLNASIGEYPLLYAFYGNTDITVIRYLLQHFNHKEPICEIISHIHTDHPTIYYISMYSKLFQTISEESWELVQPYLHEMSMSIYLHILENENYSIQMSFYKIIEDSFRFKHPVLKKALFDFLKTELRTSEDIFYKTLFGMSFRMYNDACYKHQKHELCSLWNFLQIHYFHNSLHWTHALNHYLIDTYYNNKMPMPPWNFFHWIFHSDRFYKIDLFHKTQIMYSQQRRRKKPKIYMHHQDLYTTLNMFSTSGIPYLYRKHVLETKYQSVLSNIYMIKKHIHKSIGDSLEHYFLTDKSRFL